MHNTFSRNRTEGSKNFRREQEFQQKERDDKFRELERERVLVVMSQELDDTRACLMHLYTNLDDQMNNLRVVPTSSKSVFADPYVFTNKCIIHEEVEKARRGAEPSTF